MTNSDIPVNPSYSEPSYSEVLSSRAKALLDQLETRTKGLLYEQQVHQIELEMQNEELQDAWEQAESLRRQYTDLYDSAPVGYLTLTRDGTIRHINLTGAHLLGLARSELLDRRFGLFVSPQSIPSFNAFCQGVFASHSTAECQVVLPSTGDKTIWVQMQGKRSEKEESDVCYTVMIDISERKQIEDALRQGQEMAKAVVESTDSALIVCDRDGELVIFNRTAREWYGDLLDLPLEKWSAHYALYAEDGQTLLPMESLPLTRAFRGEIVRNVSMVIMTRGGPARHVVANGNAFFDSQGQKLGAVVILHDITGRVREDAERMARKIAEQANAAKSEFLSRMSHELRTPMNSILGFAQLLEMSQKDPLTATQQTRIGQILKAGQHLLNLINEVLEISRIEAGQMDISLDAVDVERVASEVFDLTASLADERQIHLHQEIQAREKVYVKADLQRLKQALINLVSNAIKYNRSGGDVWISCTTRPNHHWRISVRDNGPGIPQAGQERIFQPFERLGAEQSGVVGTGLGLAISKRLVELMGGQIGVESREGEGSTFWVELPTATHQREADSRPLDARVLSDIGGQAYTILYIEDNLSNYELLQQILAEEGQVGLLWAIQGSIGLELARQHRPDLILLDLHLPDMPGREVLARLRQDEATSAIPVAVISADATPGQIDRLKAAGADTYLTKPLNVVEFLNTVQMLIMEK